MTNIFSQVEEGYIENKYLIVSNDKKAGDDYYSLTINDYNTREIIDSLLLNSGRMEVLDFYAPSLDSITLVYRVDRSYKTTYYHETFYKDPVTELYSGLYTSIFVHFFPSENAQLKGYTESNNIDAEMCKNFELLGHHSIRFDQRVAIGDRRYKKITYDVRYDLDKDISSGRWLKLILE